MNKLIPLFSIAAGLLLAPSAHAGKLSEGFRGVSFGDASVLETSPMPGCVAGGPVAGVRWSCTTDIGTVPVEVYYMASEGLFYGILMRAEGFANKQALFSSLQGAWGDGQEGTVRVDWLWMDGGVVGSLDYNQFTEKTVVMMSHTALSDKRDTRAAERAQAASKGDL